MGGRSSKASCSCTINFNPQSVVHNHDREIGHCPRCNHFRQGAVSRASAASTSTEYLPRPRSREIHSSSSPDRLHRKSTTEPSDLLFASLVHNVRRPLPNTAAGLHPPKYLLLDPTSQIRPDTPPRYRHKHVELLPCRHAKTTHPPGAPATLACTTPSLPLHSPAPRFRAALLP